MEHNHKIKPIVDILLNTHSKNIKVVKMKPMVLQFIDDGNGSSSAVSGATTYLTPSRNMHHVSSNVDNENMSDMSGMSDNSQYVELQNDNTNATISDASDLNDTNSRPHDQNRSYVNQLTSDRSDTLDNSQKQQQYFQSPNNNNHKVTPDVSDLTDTLPPATIWR